MPENQFYICAVDVPNGPTFLATNSLFIVTILKSFQDLKFELTIVRHLMFVLTNGFVTSLLILRISERSKYKQQKDI